jgi:hypothetical protein
MYQLNENLTKVKGHSDSHILGSTFSTFIFLLRTPKVSEKLFDLLKMYWTFPFRQWPAMKHFTPEVECGKIPKFWFNTNRRWF